MIIKWKRGRNPYVDNPYTRMQMGPNAEPRKILQQQKDLLKKLKAGRELKVGRRSLDELDIAEAVKDLKNTATRAEASLCVHRPLQSNRSRLDKLLQALEAATALSQTTPRLRLVHPLAVLWFLPMPNTAYTQAPAIEEFELVTANDAADLELDIIFDC
jgi:hypothetical protein